ncbi:MAG TPA: Holliday junction resolvase RuvX [Anaerolineae bacterium]|nr:Holliday junction resolvase RuvX [Anaerolineae bacterium]
MGRLLALDVGEKRVGVALCDETRTLARPLLTLNRASKKEDFARIATLCREHSIEKVIVGLPKTLRGEQGPQAQRVRRYASELQAALNLPIEFWDERYSSVDAQERLASASRKARAKGDIDSAAAAIILQEYLDATRGNPQPTTSN